MRSHFRHLFLQLTALDAPIVALIWQEMAAHFCGNTPQWEERLILFCSVWGIYLADRVWDVTRLPDARLPAFRHRFARRHRNIFAAGAALNFMVAFLLAYTRLTRELIAAGSILAILCGVYLWWRHAMPKWRISLPMRAGCIGSIFAAGVVLTAWMHSPHPINGLLFWIPLTLLFSANVLHAEAIESRFAGEVHGQKGFSSAIAAALIAAALLPITRDYTPVAGLILAALGTAVFAYYQERFTPDTAAALADAILIVPGALLLL